jgi:hypothetical protein
MSYFDTLKMKFLKESVETEDNFNLVDDDSSDIFEMSVAAGAGGYETPNAFGKASKDTIEQMGYKQVKKKPIKKSSAIIPDDIEESVFKRMSKEMFLQEVSYNAYKKDPSKTSKQKVNSSILEINRRLREVEKVVNHNIRLKQEMGVDNAIYWKSSREGIAKITERLVRVTQKLKELAS